MRRRENREEKAYASETAVAFVSFHILGGKKKSGERDCVCVRERETALGLCFIFSFVAFLLDVMDLVGRVAVVGEGRRKHACFFLFYFLCACVLDCT